MNAPALIESQALALADDELIGVLASSLYPGASNDSVRMVIHYCRAAGLDPMQKPVHIVPMSVKTGEKDHRGYDVKVTRDTIMPGIGLYRVQAARTGQYAGQDEPEFGPDREMTYTKREWFSVPGKDKRQPRDVECTIVYPEWVKVTVYRLVGGYRSAFVAKEFWTENYATAGRGDSAPNEMWARRVRGQLVKCAEAQALRKGFPEVGSQPTAEEMEGRFDHEDVHHFPQEPAAVVAVPRRASENVTDVQSVTEKAAVSSDDTQPPADPPAPAPAPAAPTTSAAAATSSPAATDGEKANIRVVAKARKVDLAALFERLRIVGVDPNLLDGLTKDHFKLLKGELR